MAEHPLAVEHRGDARLVQARTLDGEGRLDGADAVAPAQLRLGNGVRERLDATDEARDQTGGFAAGASAAGTSP